MICQFLQLRSEQNQLRVVDETIMEHQLPGRCWHAQVRALPSMGSAPRGSRHLSLDPIPRQNQMTPP